MKWLYFLCPLCGLAGGLLGYGLGGTPQAACTGAGLGLLAPPAFILLAAFLEA